MFSKQEYERFFWNNVTQYKDPTLHYVPNDTIHIEQWSENGDVRRYVMYEGSDIVFYEGNPFAPVKKPWLWVGNDDADITSNLSYYLVPGNRITSLLIQKHTGIENVSYMDPRSLSILKFPDEGIVVEADDTF